MFPLYLKKNRVVAFLSGLFLLLLALHLYHLYLHSAEDTYIRTLDLNKEHNPATLAAALYLLFAGYLLFYISKQAVDLPYRKAWIGLGCIFCFLALDEWGMIHDGILKENRADLDEYDFLYFVWVIPYGLLLLLFGAVYLKFFLQLPRKYQWLFALSGSIFVFGALGMEVIGASRAKNFPREDPMNLALTTIEECLEFIGIILFNYTLLSYIEDYVPHRKYSWLAFGRQAPPPSS